MRPSRSFRFLAAAGALLAVAAWVAGLVHLEWGRDSAKDVRLLPTLPFEADAGGNVWLRAEGARGCGFWGARAGRTSPDGELNLTVPLSDAEFGDRLVWVGFDCKDGSTRFARTGRVFKESSPYHSALVEVARVGMDFRRAELWLEEFLSELAYSQTVRRIKYDGTYYDSTTKKTKRCPALPRRSEDREDFENRTLPTMPDDKCGWNYFGDNYMLVEEVGTPTLSLDVSDGFALDIAIPLKIRRRETNCLFGSCGEDGLGWATLKWQLRVLAVKKTGDPDQPIELVFETEDFDADPHSWFVDALAYLMGVDSDLREDIEGTVKARANQLIRNTMQRFRESTPEQLLAFLVNDSTTVRRIAASGVLPDGLELKNVVVGSSGETLHFSLMASRSWMGTDVPALAATDTGQSVSVSVSYAFINRLLGLVLDDRPLNDVLNELRSMLVLSGAVDAETFDEAAEQAAGLGCGLKNFFTFSELRFDDSLPFELPLRLRPVSAGETRVFFANAEVLTVDPAPTYSDRLRAKQSSAANTAGHVEPTGRSADKCDPNATTVADREGTAPPAAAKKSGREVLEGVAIGLSAEGRVAFDRSPSARDVDFLLDHIAFEPLITGRQQVHPAMARYYALTPLFHRLLRWERQGDLEGEVLGEQLKNFRTNVISIVRSASLREHAPAEFEVYADDAASPPQASSLRATTSRETRSSSRERLATRRPARCT